MKSKILLAVQTYEEKLIQLLFKEHEISLQGFMAKAEEYFCLNKEESMLITRYLFERRNKPKVTYDSGTIRRANFIIRRLREFVGKYTKIETDDLNDLKVDFQCNDDITKKTEFVMRLKEMTLCDHVTILEILNLVDTTGIKLDTKTLIIYLCRFSSSLTKIQPSAIKQLLKI